MKQKHTVLPDSAAGIAVPEKIPAHKTTQVTRTGGSHAVSAPASETKTATAEESNHVET